MNLGVLERFALTYVDCLCSKLDVPIRQEQFQSRNSALYRIESTIIDIPGLSVIEHGYEVDGARTRHDA